MEETDIILYLDYNYNNLQLHYTFLTLDNPRIDFNNLYYLQVHNESNACKHNASIYEAELCLNNTNI